MAQMVNYTHLTASGQSVTVGGAGADTQVVSVNVNTGAASAVLTISDSTSLVNVAIIDCATKISLFYGGIRVPGGAKFALTGGNADVTVAYS